MNKKLFAFILALMLIVPAILTPNLSAAAGDVDFSGTWTYDSKYMGEDYRELTAVTQLKQVGNQVTGRMLLEDPDGTITINLQGSVKGNILKGTSIGLEYNFAFEYHMDTIDRDKATYYESESDGTLIDYSRPYYDFRVLEDSNLNKDGSQIIQDVKAATGQGTSQASGQAGNFTGTWTYDSEYMGSGYGEQTAAVQFNQAGNQVTGRMVIEEAGGAFTINMKGTVNGNILKGTATSPDGSYDFEMRIDSNDPTKATYYEGYTGQEMKYSVPFYFYKIFTESNLTKDAGQVIQDVKVATGQTGAVSSDWTGTWEILETKAGRLVGKQVIYIEQRGNLVYGSIYKSSSDGLNNIDDNFKGIILQDGSVVGLYWYGGTYHSTPVHAFRMTPNGIEATFEDYIHTNSNPQPSVNRIRKTSNSFPAEKMLTKNYDFEYTLQRLPGQSDRIDILIPAEGGQVQTSTSQAQTPAPTQTGRPTPDNAIEISMTGGEAKDRTQAFNGITGITVNIPVHTGTTTRPIGYRLYRSEVRGQLGISVTDFYITSLNFTDVNCEANTTYYYTLKEILAEARPLEGIREKEGRTLATWTVTTADNIGNVFEDPTATRHFVMLKIDDPMMSVDGIQKEVDPGRGTAPLVLRNRTMVPIRAIVESMGGTAGWDQSDFKVSLKANGNSVDMWIDKKDYKVNGTNQKLDVPPYLSNQRTFVPVRFSAENLKCQVDWLNSTKQIVIVWSD